MITNVVVLTNIVWMLCTGTVPVAVQSFDESTYFNESSYMFVAGFSYGFPCAIALATVWAIIASMRGYKYPTIRD